MDKPKLAVQHGAEQHSSTQAGWGCGQNIYYDNFTGQKVLWRSLQQAPLFSEHPSFGALFHKQEAC